MTPAVDGPTLVHLRAGGVSVVVDTTTGAPTLHHWGAALGEDDPAVLARALERPLAVNLLDPPAPLTLVPEHGAGFPGRPGLRGARPDGTAWSPRYTTRAVEAGPDHVVVDAVDPAAALALRCELRLDRAGVLRLRARLTNEGAGPYHLEALALSLPLPAKATELLTFAGRWAREMHPHRVPFGAGAWTTEHRAGRTGHASVPFVLAGAPGFGEEAGEVWGVHLAWSGNHGVLAEHTGDGRAHVQIGELLHPGEVVLGPGDAYDTPWVHAVHAGDGLNGVRRAVHRSLRARASHPTSPRKVLLNTWEAVYFDHDRDRLSRLAERAAAVGVERFVLDDGWFGGRRHDRAGLGDWTVSPEAHPDGLGPLIAHVHGLGMDFGIWVEPEMVNPDSDLFRAHPDWALTTPGYEPVLGRHQLVLDLARPEAFVHVRDQLDALLREHDIVFVKWDMNRDHAQGSGADGRAGSHRQTLAVLRLLDELRSRHPGVEFESCASGGGRIDLGILERVERVWTSDCNDALERQVIQGALSLLVPPELMGAHIGPGTSHTTGRRHPLAFRAATALFGHLGIEWDLLRLDDAELAALREVVAIHKRHRALLHGGEVVRVDHPGDAAVVHGVVSPDRSEALFAYVQLRTEAAIAPAPLRIPGLDRARRYDVRRVALPGERWGMALRQPAWLHEGTQLSGRALAAAGVQPPALHPESAVLVHVTAS